MFISIQVDTNDLTETDRAILSALADAGSDRKEPGDTPGRVIQMADAKAAQAKGKDDDTESTPAPTRSRTRKAAAKATAPAPEPQEDDTDADEADEDLLGDEEKPVLDRAVDRATELVAAQKGAAVKAALKKVKATKVREMDDSQAEKFLAALADA